EVDAAFLKLPGGSGQDNLAGEESGRIAERINHAYAGGKGLVHRHLGGEHDVDRVWIAADHGDHRGGGDLVVEPGAEGIDQHLELELRLGERLGPHSGATPGAVTEDDRDGV